MDFSIHSLIVSPHLQVFHRTLITYEIKTLKTPNIYPFWRGKKTAQIYAKIVLHAYLMGVLLLDNRGVV